MQSHFFISAFSANALAADRAYLGFGVSTETTGFFLSPKLERVWIARVEQNSPADQAGLLVDDVLLSANGRILSGAPAKDMMALMRSLKPGDRLALVVQRSGKEINVNITAGSR